MKTLLKPTLKTKDIYDLCISQIRDSDLLNRLQKCSSLIVEAEAEFDSKAKINQTHTISKEKMINGNVTAAELKNVYTARMVPKDSAGREMYDKLKNSVPLGICPLCNHKPVEVLDHYLPKAHFPRLSVTPINLVPTCTDCNNTLSDKGITTIEETKLHPYYDELGNEVWLKAKVIKGSPAAISFFVQSPASWSEILSKRVHNYFGKLSLGKLYSIQAAVSLSDLDFLLRDKYDHLGKEGVREYLINEGKSRELSDPNSWRSAFYKAIAADDWFCDGGFKIF